jgi:hypothetical protein
MRMAKFVFDLLGDQSFEGYARLEYWYGFACPYFTYDQAQNVVEAWLSWVGQASYDSEHDQFTFEMIIEGRKNSWSFSGVDIEGMRLYPVGAYYWFWDEEKRDR